MTLTLRAGDWVAELRPDTGGALAALRLGGTDVLRTMPGSAIDPLESACFPLVPWCNRIRGGRFSWSGRMVQLPENFPPEPHSLHGLGWHSVWQVTAEAGFKCTLGHSHSGTDAWPWSYEAEQRIRLGSQGCAITLDVTNRSETPMPCGLGLHPYVRRRPETHVRFSSTGMLLADAGLIPNGEIAASPRFADSNMGAALPSETVDHCFAGWSGRALIEDDLGSIAMTARGAPFLHLYAPADGSALCLEPVSHGPDALNRAPAEMTVLAPGCTASLTLRISATLAG
ncbi:aldose 1-epimerase [Croceibacterium aestuarii]|uniref:aldose 1-epimerase n=1 Tax=Croceibacterium aestuarii TaxID=3064139 RepID=UPI00272DCA55|nr:aldose 1-epimerase [Croceibacterium sp. D39]